jgi:hypothetical protein
MYGMMDTVSAVRIGNLRARQEPKADKPSNTILAPTATQKSNSKKK